MKTDTNRNEVVKIWRIAWKAASRKHLSYEEATVVIREEKVKSIEWRHSSAASGVSGGMPRRRRLAAASGAAALRRRRYPPENGRRCSRRISAAALGSSAQREISWRKMKLLVSIRLEESETFSAFLLSGGKRRKGYNLWRRKFARRRRWAFGARLTLVAISKKARRGGRACGWRRRRGRRRLGVYPRMFSIWNSRRTAWRKIATATSWKSPIEENESPYRPVSSMKAWLKEEKRKLTAENIVKMWRKKERNAISWRRLVKLMYGCESQKKWHYQ